MSKARIFPKALTVGLVLTFVLVGCGAPAATPLPTEAEPGQAATEAPTEAAPTLLSIPSLTAPVEATLPPGWETYTSQGQCGYTISHPADVDGASQGAYSWTLSVSATEPSGPVPSFIYISVIPDDFQSSEPGAIYNYDPAETQTLLNMQVGESKSLRDDPNIASSFTYTRLADTTLGNQPAQAYENSQPWEFPPGTKEIRYYLKANGCTYLIGGYLATAGSGQPGTIEEELFDQIIATFRLTP